MHIDHPQIRRMVGYQDSCAPVEVSFPADILHDARVARWVREHRLAIDVRTVAELHSAISVGVHPARMTVHADQWSVGELRRARAAGVGRVVLSRPEHITSLRTGRVQNVLLRITDSRPADSAADAVIGCRSTALIGLRCEIGTAADQFVTATDAVSATIAQMDHIRGQHAVVLTRLILGIDDDADTAGSSIVRRDLAEEIDESIDDACATLRFPRPTVVMSASYWPRSA